METKKVILIDLFSFEQYSLASMILEKLLTANNVKVEIINSQEEIKKGNIKKERLYKDLVALISQKNPTHIGFSAMGNNYVKIILLAKKIKEEFPEIKIFLGGPQASVTDKETLNSFPFIDFIFRGEVENAIEELSEYIKGNIKPKKVPNLTYKQGRGIIRNDKKPLISESKLPTIKYKKEYLNRAKIVCIEGGRGCPFNCTYCSSSNYWQNNFRMKPVNTLISEMKENITKNQDRISIIHDIFTLNKEKLKKFCKKIENKNISWSCSARTDSLENNLIKLMKKAGCVGVFLGIETGDKKIQKKINKNLDLEHADKVINEIRGIDGIKAITSFIIGFPFDNLNSLYNTIKKIFKYKNNYCEIRIFTLKPVKGSFLYEQYKNSLFFDKLFYSTDSFITGLTSKDEEIKLIQEYPSLFSYYYRIKPDFFNVYYFAGLKKIIRIMLDSFPETFYLWVKKFKNNPKIFFKKISTIMNHNNKYKITKEELLKLKNKQEVLLSFINYFEDSDRYIDQELKNTFEKEINSLKERVIK